MLKAAIAVFVVLVVASAQAREFNCAIPGSVRKGICTDSARCARAKGFVFATEGVSCPAGKGCCAAAIAAGSLVCVGAPLSARKECGYYGIQKAECENKGCCWQPTGPVGTPGVPWCFSKTVASASTFGASGKPYVAPAPAAPAVDVPAPVTPSIVATVSKALADAPAPAPAASAPAPVPATPAAPKPAAPKPVADPGAECHAQKSCSSCVLSTSGGMKCVWNGRCIAASDNEGGYISGWGKYLSDCQAKSTMDYEKAREKLLWHGVDSHGYRI